MTIEEKAKEYIETCIDDDPVNPFAAIARIEGRDAFKRGAEWMREELLIKALDWLKENTINYTYFDSDEYCSGLMTGKFIRDFKKAMEE